MAKASNAGAIVLTSNFLAGVNPTCSGISKKGEPKITPCSFKSGFRTKNVLIIIQPIEFP